MKKVISAFALSLIGSLTHAEIPSQLKVYTTGSPGPTVVCRALFAEYDKKYNSTTQFVIKPGVGGTLALAEMIRDKDFAVDCMTGLSESVFNNTVYPGFEAEHAALTLSSIILKSGVYYVTGNNNKANTLPQLLASKKDIVVGIPSTSAQFVGGYVFGSHAITWVPYKSSAEAVSSLMDGSLDVFIDYGSLVPVMKSGKLKGLGFLNGTAGENLGPDLNSTYPLAAKIQVTGAIATSNRNNPADIEEMSKRISSLIDDEAVSSAIKKIGAIPVKMTAKDSNAYIDFIRKEYAAKYKPAK